jgi:heme-degrading monooxygenase HmoA
MQPGVDTFAMFPLKNRYSLSDLAVTADLARMKEDQMILEIAQIDVKPGSEAEFESGVRRALPIFKRARGCRGLTLQRSIEKPSRFRLFIQWDTVENHTIEFRGSTDFQDWRKLVGHTFASPPEVEHVREVLKGF